MSDLAARNEKLTRQRWVILAASCCINLCIGSGYAWSVFASPMAKELDAASLAIVFTVCNAVGPVTMIPGGRINDRFGPKWVILAGGILFGLGMFLSGFATSVGMILATYGLGCGLGLGLVYTCTIGNSVKLFPDKRGLAGGIATAVYGISSVIVPPVASAITSSLGVRAAFRTLGLVFLAVICIADLLFLKPCPPDFVPTGWTPPAPAGKSGAAVDKNWRQMLADPNFYVMMLILTCGAVFGMMTISQASPLAQNMVGLSAGTAATVVSVLALFNTAGRIISGVVSDRLGRINTLAAALVLAVAGLGLLYASGAGTVVPFVAGIALVGVCFGTFMGVFPGFAADQFGAKYNTVNYGIMFIGFSLAGIIGPLVMSGIYGSQGRYQPAFLVAIALAAAGFALTFVYRRMNRKE